MTVPRNIFKKVKTFRPKIFINIKKIIKNLKRLHEIQYINLSVQATG